MYLSLLQKHLVHRLQHRCGTESVQGLEGTKDSIKMIDTRTKSLKMIDLSK